MNWYTNTQNTLQHFYPIFMGQIQNNVTNVSMETYINFNNYTNQILQNENENENKLLVLPVGTAT